MYANDDSVAFSTSALYTVWVVLDEPGSIKLGVTYKDGGSVWAAYDEFTLLYYGVEAATKVQEYAEEVKQAAEIVEIYNVAGVAQPSLQPGVTIVKYANGDVKKIQVKK